MHYEILAGQPGDGRKRALLSCLPLKGGVEDFPTVGTDLLLVPVKGPFVHNDGVLHRKSGHRLTCGGVVGPSAPTPTSVLSYLACFPFFNRCMRYISSSAPTRKTFQAGLDLPLVGAAHFSPCHWLVAPAAGSGSLLMYNKNRISMVRVNIAVTVRSTTAGWLLRLRLCLSR